jgi:hypothetical protein
VALALTDVHPALLLAAAGVLLAERRKVHPIGVAAILGAASSLIG